jgi:hypothetical protein
MYSLFVALATLAILVVAYPWHPRTALGWVVLVLSSLPICTAAAFIEDLFALDPVAARIDAATRGKSISTLRMLYLFARSAVVICAMLGAILLVRVVLEHWGAL